MSTLANCNAKILELIDVLKQESKLLSQGRVDGLEDLYKAKAAGMASLETYMAALQDHQSVMQIAPQIQTLKKLANENGVILKSVMNGLRSAQERLKVLQYKEAKVGAYNRAGGGLFLSENQHLSEKRV